MRLEPADLDALRPIIAETVRAVLAEIDGRQARLSNGRLAYPLAEAAGLLGVAPHVLRDAIRRGELRAAKVGKRTVIRRDELVRFLEHNT